MIDNSTKESLKNHLEQARQNYTASGYVVDALEKAVDAFVRGSFDTAKNYTDHALLMSKNWAIETRQSVMQIAAIIETAIAYERGSHDEHIG